MYIIRADRYLMYCAHAMTTASHATASHATVSHATASHVTTPHATASHTRAGRTHTSCCCFSELLWRRSISDISVMFSRSCCSAVSVRCMFSSLQTTISSGARNGSRPAAGGQHYTRRPATGFWWLDCFANADRFLVVGLFCEHRPVFGGLTILRTPTSFWWFNYFVNTDMNNFAANHCNSKSYF